MGQKRRDAATKVQARFRGRTVRKRLAESSGKLDTDDAKVAKDVKVSNSEGNTFLDRQLARGESGP